MEASLSHYSFGKPAYNIISEGRVYRYWDGQYHLVRNRKKVDQMYVSIMHDRHARLRQRIDRAVGDVQEVLDVLEYLG